MATVILNPGKEKPVIQRHPWVFSGAISTVQGYVGRGDAVDVANADGEWLARGTWSSGSQIRVRLFTWDRDEPIDEQLLRRRIERAVAGRKMLLDPDRSGDSARLIFAESDGLPGLIVDKYGDFLSIQLLTQGMAARSELITAILADMLQPRGIYERSDPDMREKESLPPSEGVLWGEEPPEQLVIRQHTMKFHTSIQGGQKTGFFLDQSRNRRVVASYCAGRDVLDCFSYSGGFTLYAAQAGAGQITAIDSSAAAIEALQANLTLNRVQVPVESEVADVFQKLRQYRFEKRQFDVVILDPPKFAHAAGHIERATRGYKDINLIAMQILRPGGILATFSCSGLISADLFQKVIFGAAVDARRDVQIIERLTQSPDHPVTLTFPEGEYLKGLVCRVW
ncbi:methyltransferase domain-containing protein [Chloroflexia bacterium SDU3-3]|nr:methyltransferase domain-containing protein [Chloroflexia bacterium SDU3-3]